MFFHSPHQRYELQNGMSIANRVSNSNSCRLTACSLFIGPAGSGFPFGRSTHLATLRQRAAYISQFVREIYFLN